MTDSQGPDWWMGGKYYELVQMKMYEIMIARQDVRAWWNGLMDLMTLTGWTLLGDKVAYARYRELRSKLIVWRDVLYDPEWERAPVQSRERHRRESWSKAYADFDDITAEYYELIHKLLLPFTMAKSKHDLAKALGVGGGGSDVYNSGSGDNVEG